MENADWVHYMERSRNYYAAQGYTEPYYWAHYDDVPFHVLGKPLAESIVTVVTTAMPDASYRGRQRRLAVGDLTHPPERLYTGDLAWDNRATHTDDRETYLPVHQLGRLVVTGRLGALAPHFYYAPTEYSQRRTIERDAPAIVAGCRDDGVDVALLVPL